MGSRADFHPHSTFSDGVLTPTELIELAYRRGVRVMALTDHDTTEGLPEAFAAAAPHPDLTLIPGIEMSTDVPGSEVHILGHFIDWHEEEFQRRLVHLRDSRLGRARGGGGESRWPGSGWRASRGKAPSAVPTSPAPSSRPGTSLPSTKRSISI